MNESLPSGAAFRAFEQEPFDSCSKTAPTNFVELAEFVNFKLYHGCVPRTGRVSNRAIPQNRSHLL